MNCPSQERLALHACGDVPDASVESHLAHCAACRALALAFRNDAELLASKPAVPDAAVDALDVSVHNRLWTRGALRWSAAIAAVAAALAIAVWLRPTSDQDRRTHPVVSVRPPQVIAPAPQAPPRESPRVLAASRPPRPRSRAHAARPAVEKPDEPVRLVPQTSGAIVIAKSTADPNVLILLVGEEDPHRGEPNDN